MVSQLTREAGHAEREKGRQRDGPSSLSSILRVPGRLLLLRRGGDTQEREKGRKREIKRETGRERKRENKRERERYMFAAYLYTHIYKNTNDVYT